MATWLVGFFAYSVQGLLCVRWLLRFIATPDFKVSGWHRIPFGTAVLVTWQFGLVNWASP